jgi:hypothetical protein
MEGGAKYMEEIEVHTKLWSEILQARNIPFVCHGCRWKDNIKLDTGEKY